MTKLFLFTLTVSILFINADCKKDIVDPPQISQTQDTGVKITDGIHPAISPNGQWIAFSRYGSIFVCDTSGKQERQLTNSVNDILPRFSPDGKKVGFARVIDNNNAEIYSISLADSQIVKLSGAYRLSLYFLASIFTRYPIWEWSPTGSNIAFLQQVTNYDVFLRVMHSNGDGLLIGNYKVIDTSLPVSIDDHTTASFCWSPDGLHLTCATNATQGSGYVGIITIGYDSIKQFTNDTAEVFPVWTYDGKEILYESLFNGKVILKDVNTFKESLLPTTNRMYSPQVSPDKINIVYASSEYTIEKDTDIGVYISLLNIYNINNKTFRQLTTYGNKSREDNKNYFFEWEKNSQYIYFERLQSIWKIKP